MGEIEEYVYQNFIKPHIFIQEGRECVLKSDMELAGYSHNELLMIKNILLEKNIVMVKKKLTMKDILKNKLHSIIYEDVVGSKYIVKSDLERLNLSKEEKEYLDSKLPNSSISIIDSIKVLDRPRRVIDFEYGFINEAKINPADETKLTDVQYNKNGEIESVDYTRLDDFIINVFIPEHVHIKVRLGDKYGPEYYSIQLNKITKLKLSEMEIDHVMELLKEQNIIVCGTSEYPEEAFVNYDYFYKRKNIIVPENISKEETIELFRNLQHAKTLEEKAQIRNDIIVGNMRLAKWVLFKMSSYYGLDSSWETYAYEGLIQAVDRFDVDLGYYFSTFATVTIRHFIQKNVCDFYKLNQNIFSDFMRAMKIVESNYERKYRLGDDEMLEDILDLLVNINCISEKSKEAYKKKINSINLESSVSEEDLYNVYDIASLDEIIDNIEMRKEVIDALNQVTDRENKILQLRYGLYDGEEKTQGKVAKYFNLSKGRIGQLEARAFRNLRWGAAYKHNNLKVYKDYQYSHDDFRDYSQATDIEYNPSNDMYDEYYDSEQDSMENPNYKDALEELDELYKEENTKSRRR